MAAGNHRSSVHRVDLPRIVLVGWDILDSLSDVCRELGYSRAQIVTGETTYGIAGKRCQGILNDSLMEAECTFVCDATMETVNRVVSDVAEMDVNVVLGVGGGRNIDVAKLAAAKTDTFFISVPTVASHDGIASNLASVKGLKSPYTVKAVSPIAVLMDSKIIAESPYQFTASGCGDIVSKAVEVEDWRLAHRENGDYYGGYAGSLSLMSAYHVMEGAELIRGRTEEGIRILLEALTSCGVAMSIAGSSRPCSGSSHLFSHALDQLAPKPALHGEQCGVGAIMMAKLHSFDWMNLRDSLKTIGAPTTARELGIPRRIIVESLVKAKEIRPNRYTILSKIRLSTEDAEALAEECGVI